MTFMEIRMLGCLIFVFSCIVANVIAVILSTRNVETKKDMKNIDVKRNNESSDDVEMNGNETVSELFDLTRIIEKIEISQKNAKNERLDINKPGCFPVGTFTSGIKKYESSGSNASKVRKYFVNILPSPTSTLGVF